jgi:hypothetical protein
MVRVAYRLSGPINPLFYCFNFARHSMCRGRRLTLFSTGEKAMINRSDTFQKNWRLALLVAIIVFALVTILGKGGGDPPADGGGGDPPAEGGSSNWDQMVWDQDDWA